VRPGPVQTQTGGQLLTRGHARSDRSRSSITEKTVHTPPSTTSHHITANVPDGRILSPPLGGGNLTS